MMSFKRQIATRFSILAVVVIATYYVIFQATLHWTEDAVSSRRLALLSDYAVERYGHGETGMLKLNQFAVAYDNYFLLPETIMGLITPEWRGTEDFVWNGSREIVILAETVTIHGREQPLYLVEDTTNITLSDEMELLLEIGFLVISVLMLTVVCLVVIRMAGRLSAPLHYLAHELDQADAGSLAPLNGMPATTSEIYRLTEALNGYRRRIRKGIERERAFSRYVSHELRTPITVARGVATLLGLSSDRTFLDKQQARLEKACQNMTDITETLLALVRVESATVQGESVLDHAFFEELIEDSRQLLDNKPVEVAIEVENSLTVPAPETVMRMLAGNLIRNAFSYTEVGQVTLSLSRRQLTITDTGIGLDVKPEQHEGHGLGLVMVRDICRKYHWSFALENRADNQGCQANVVFSPEHVS